MMGAPKLKRGSDWVRWILFILRGWWKAYARGDLAAAAAWRMQADEAMKAWAESEKGKA